MLRKRNTDSAIAADPPNNKVAAAHIEAVPKPELKEPRHSFAPSNCRTSAERAGAGSLAPSFPLFDFRGVLELLVGDIHAVSAEPLIVVQHLLMGASGDSPD